MKKYTAQITDNMSTVKFEIEGYGKTPQEFHKTVLFEHINYPYEEILFIFNGRGNRVFNLRSGFSGS